MRLLFTSAALIFGLLSSGANSAFAAKGVKKKATNGSHQAHGVVTHVHHHKGVTANGHIGEITIKTHHHKKKGQAAAKGNKVSGHTHKFSVGTSTKFSVAHGKQHTAASFAAIHKGEHVSIVHKGNHASSVTVHKHTTKGNKVAGKPKNLKKKKVNT